jgi:hypothetical protein
MKTESVRKDESVQRNNAGQSFRTDFTKQTLRNRLYETDFTKQTLIERFGADVDKKISGGIANVNQEY